MDTAKSEVIIFVGLPSLWQPNKRYAKNVIMIELLA